MAIPDEPVGLGRAGKRLWKALHTQWDLDSDEVALVAEACAVTDEIIRMRIVLAQLELIVSGSTGQQVINPLVSEIRANREQLRKLLGSIRAPALQEATSGGVITEAARAAAAARWVRSGGSRGA